jgi:hypothetical protein
MKKITLEKIIKFNNGLNVITNAGVGFKDIELSFDISVFKAESLKLVTAFQEVVKTLKGTDKEKEAEIEILLKKEYEINAPVLKLDAIKTSEKEIPLVAFDFLHEFMTK